MPIFCYYRAFLLGHQSVLVFWKKMVCSVKMSTLRISLSVQKFWNSSRRQIMDSGRDLSMTCLNVWKCVGVCIIKNGSVLGFWLWDLICEFQSTFVVITDFLCGKSKFPYSNNNFWSSEFVTIFFVKSSQDPRVQEISICCFWFTFLWLSLQKEHFFKKPSGIFISF